MADSQYCLYVQNENEKRKAEEQKIPNRASSNGVQILQAHLLGQAFQTCATFDLISWKCAIGLKIVSPPHFPIRPSD